METIVRCDHCHTKNRLRPRAEGIPRCANCKHPLPWIVDASDADFDQEVTASVPVIVDFWAPWCGPCRMIAPILEGLAHDHAGSLKVVRLNVDDNRASAERYEAMSIPLLVVFERGEEVDRVVGAMPRPQLEQRLARFLREPAPAAAPETTSG
jgi:thioredoxin 2